ncbi:MAG: hypothetical protein LBM67_00130 [Lentimicrobiaceae bacterium]|jgi:hypothetical protein|nr:hypothetical protein [Lentimicrobiaceae bacterium]
MKNIFLKINTTDLKGHIFITVGERSVAYGKGRKSQVVVYDKSRLNDIIANNKFCLSGSSVERLHYYRRSLTYGYETKALRATGATLKAGGLKSQIFITASERSVACGNKNSATYGKTRYSHD